MGKHRRIGWCVFKGARNYYACFDCPKPCNAKPTLWWRLKEWVLCRVMIAIENLP